MSGRLTKVPVPQRGLPDTTAEFWFKEKNDLLVLAEEVLACLRNYRIEENSQLKKGKESDGPCIDFARWEWLEVNFVVDENLTKVYNQTQCAKIRALSKEEEDRVVMVIEVERTIPEKKPISESCKEHVPGSPWKVTRVRYNLVPSNSITLSTIECLEGPEPEEDEMVGETQQPVEACA